MPNSIPELSIVIPILNEEAILPELQQRLLNVLTSLGVTWEVFFVDDGSTDRSAPMLQASCAEIEGFGLIQLSRNFGHQAALFAGLQHTQGNAVVIMDGDLEDPPEALELFLEKWREGWDVVYAIRYGRKNNLWVRAASWLHYRLLASLANIRVPVDAGIFCLMDRKVVKELAALTERNQYLSGLRAWVGFRQTGVPVERGSRYGGGSRVGTRRLLALALNAIFSFSYVPLRLATLVGVITSLASFAYAGVVLYKKFVSHQAILGWASILFAILFLGGIQLTTLGILGEYIGRIYDEAKQRPIFVIANLLKPYHGGKEGPSDEEKRAGNED